MCHPQGLSEPEYRSGVQRRDVEIALASGESMPARICEPAGAAWGSVVIAVDIFGANRFYKGLSERLAEAGCAVILPDIFFREGPLADITRELAFERRGKLDDGRAVSDISQALDSLVATTGTKAASLGFCLGGTLVYNLAAQRDDLATVSYYGFPAGVNAPKAIERPLDIIDEISGPILAFWGDQDAGVGMDNVAAFNAAMEKTSIEYAQNVYPDVGHGFLAALDEDPGSAGHKPAADSWDRALAFLRKQLEN